MTLYIPEPSVSIRQAKQALLQAGYLDQIETYMATAPKTVTIDWEEATQVTRSYPLVEQMRILLGLTEEDIDDLFEVAVTL